MNKDKKRFIIILILVLIISVLGVFAYDKFSAGQFGKNELPDYKSANENQDDQATQAVQKEFTISPEELEQALLSNRFSNVSREFLDNSMPNRALERTQKTGFSDAVSLPFSVVSLNGQKPASASKAVLGKQISEKQLRDELTNEILRNPVFTDMVIRGLSDKKIGNKTIGELNAGWLKPFDEAYASPNGIASFLEKDTATGKILVTEAYRRQAIGVALLLDRFTSGSVKEYKSSENFKLGFQTEFEKVRTEKAEYQENLAAFILTIRTKDGSDKLIIGFNMFDKRFEYFKPQQDPKPSPAPQPQPTPKQDPAPKPPQNQTPQDQTPYNPQQTVVVDETPSDPKKEEIQDPKPSDPKTPEKPKYPDPDPGKPNKPEKPKDPDPGKPIKPVKDIKKDPAYNDRLEHRGTGPNRPDDGPGPYQEKPPVFWPNQSGAPTVQKNEYYNKTTVPTEIVQTPVQKQIPVVKEGDKEYYVENGKKEEINGNDNVTPPPTEPIPVQPKTEQIQKDPIVEGEVDLGGI